MDKTQTTAALTVFTSTELKADSTELKKLQEFAIAQFERMRGIRQEEMIRGLMLGLTLLRIRASLPYGEFGTWLKANCQVYSERWSRYLMRLAMVFTVKSRVTKPMMLQMPGDQTELQLESLQGAQRQFMEKALKFCGDLSLSELLAKYGIKESKQIGGRREKTTEEPPVELSGEQLYLLARDEIGAALERAESLFITENRLQHLAGHPEEIRGVVQSLRALADKVEAAAKPILKS